MSTTSTACCVGQMKRTHARAMPPGFHSGVLLFSRHRQPVSLRQLQVAGRAADLPHGEIFETATQLVVLTASESTSFEPRMDPGIAVAAVAAAIPPILFWSRVVLAEQRRKREAEEKERTRQVG
jgi:hypothetical protein